MFRNVPPKDKRPARRADMEIRFAQLTVLPPPACGVSIAHIYPDWTQSVKDALVRRQPS